MEFEMPAEPAPAAFAALKQALGEARRPAGVPWYLRSGKRLAATTTEVLVQFKPPPQRLFADSAPFGGQANYLRSHLSPGPAARGRPDRSRWRLAQPRSGTVS